MTCYDVKNRILIKSFHKNNKCKVKDNTAISDNTNIYVPQLFL